ncbi:GxxExxY protein [Aequorivita marina]|nr:GxxExxY protein [Aequorivita sp. S2608]MDS1299069.1 GxxExxY protein [Aequorivita sp. S2608]
MPKAFYKQLNNYLLATNKELGMLVNFGKPSLEYKRIIKTKHSHKNSQ